MWVAYLLGEYRDTRGKNPCLGVDYVSHHDESDDFAMVNLFGCPLDLANAVDTVNKTVEELLEEEKKLKS